MQSDDQGLVAKLRKKRMRVHDLSGVGWEDDPDCHAAAAAIERLVAERDEARAEVARYWTSADMTPWVNLAEEKGLGHFGKKLKGMFNRAMTAEAASRSYAEALRQIADLDEVESALDPEWTINRARQALKDAP